MIRWALLVEYDGGSFVGWQRQANGVSVQEILETAAAKLNGDNPVASTCRGSYGRRCACRRTGGAT